MPMFAMAADTLEVAFDAKNSITFRMHADLSMDLLRWLRRQAKRLEMMGKRADKLEAKAIDLDLDQNEKFEELAGQADTLRSKGGDELDVLEEYIKQACVGWTDYFADQDAMQRGEVLPFTPENIRRIGIMKLSKIVIEFNRHYGLTEDTDVGKENAASLPEPSPSKVAAPASPSGTPTSTPTA